MVETAIRTSLALAAMTIALLACPLRGAAEDYLDSYDQGEFALRVQKWDRAIEWFTKSIQENPNFHQTYHFRAIAYSKRGEYDKSIEDLKKAVQLNPEYPDAYALMGLVYEIKKEYAAALTAYQEALAREKYKPAQEALQKYIQDVEAKLRKK